MTSLAEKLAKASTEDIGNFFSDYYKDVHGFRPRHIDFNDREALIKGIEDLDTYMETLMSTEEGRALLRSEGWNV